MNFCRPFHAVLDPNLRFFLLPKQFNQHQPGPPDLFLRHILILFILIYQDLSSKTLHVGSGPHQTESFQRK